MIYPNFARCISYSPTPSGMSVGGIACGRRGAFAAVWGVVGPAGAIWLISEEVGREQPLGDHAARLPRAVAWYGKVSRAESHALREAGLTIHEAKDDLHAGIAAVNARINSRRLYVKEHACPNLVREAGRYRLSDGRAEGVPRLPEDEEPHALRALRYLITSLDDPDMARRRNQPTTPKGLRPLRHFFNPALWTRIWPPE